MSEQDTICEDCEDDISDDSNNIKLAEAFETFDALLCDSCFDNRCEAAWDRQQESHASEPPMTLNEQHQRAWAQKQELRR